MAPILKEADSPVTTTATTTTASAPKSPSEAPARPQPVPLEIPVTVNGARTVEGSDKREPFAETTQTVLVFPHGAVIRIATPLSPGQLVFLTNEKTKKEVVCQVVKSKSGGSASGYVELQFTEPAPAFWGLGTTPAPPATAPAPPRPVAATPAPKVAPPAIPVAKTPAPTTLAPSIAQIPVPQKPTAIPPPAPSVPALEHAVAPPQQSSAPAISAPPASVATPPPAPKLPEAAPVHTVAPANSTLNAPLVSVPPPSPIGSDTPASSLPKAPKPLIPPPSTGPRDYSKDIDSLFAVPQAGEPSQVKSVTSALPPPPPVASSPSTEELKQQAARLQEQLSAMLFTEAPPAPSKSPTPSSDSKLVTPAAEVANKLLEIVQEEPKAAADLAANAEISAAPKPDLKPEPKPATPTRTPALPTLSAQDEEVEIPAWLRPLSRHSDVIAESPAAVEPANSGLSFSESAPAVESSSVDSSVRSDAAVFGGQLLAGDPAAEPTTNSSSKKGLFLGLAAAAVLLAAGGYWYYQQNHPAVSTPQPAKTIAAPAVAQPAASAPSISEPTPPSRQATNSPAPSNQGTSVPARTSTPPAPSVPAPVEVRRGNETRSPAPAEVAAKKPSLGEVHLAAPVVRGSGEGNASGEPLPSIDAPIGSSGADALAAVAHHKAPAAPIPVGGDVKPAQLVKSVPPVYPQMAKTQRISGNVTLDALIDTAGNVAQLKVLSGPPLLHQAALDAVRQWKYTPAQLDGNPTAMHLTVTVQFRTQ